MRLSLRFVLPLLLALGLVAYAVLPLVDQLTLNWFVRDLDIRAILIANTVQEPLVGAGARRMHGRRSRRSSTASPQDERLYAIGFCDAQRRQFIATRAFPADIRCDGLDRFADGDTRLLASAKGPLHVVGRDSARGQRDPGQAGARPRHELRRSGAARRPSATSSTSSSRLGAHGLADHRRHRAAELARLGAGHARAAARRGPAAARRRGSRCRSCGRSRATCAR